MRDTKRQDIQGLRAISALLVAIFHIFEWGISGGVDVFLTVSGFFLWFKALKLVEGSRDYLDYFRGFFTRTVPQTLLVIMVVLGVSYVLVSPAEWSSILRDSAFSAVFLQNYRLAILDHDYLARSESLSLFQHYWAVSVIAQVYFVFFALALVANLIAKYAKFRKKDALALIIAFVSIFSFLWFIYLSFNFPRLMHYETLARIWQFGAGALVAGLTSQLKITSTSGSLKDVMSWVGFLIVLLCGFLIEHSFPGFGSIYPTFGALLILIFSSDIAINRRNTGFWLSQKFLVLLGSISFGIYLWHWPIYAIYYRYIPEQTPLSASIIIVASAALAILGIRVISYIRNIFGQNFVRNERIWVTPALIIGVFVMCLHLDQVLRSSNSLIYSAPHFLSDAHLTLSKIRQDLPVSYKDNCHQNSKRDDVSICSFGNKDSDMTIYLIGGSHSAQWLPPLVKIAQREAFHLVSITKSECRFFDPTDDSAKNYLSESCRAWNLRVMKLIAEKKPTVVITLANTRGDEAPESIKKAIAKLTQKGITVVALRDTPFMPIDAPACATHFKIMGLPKCQIPRTELFNEKKYEATAAALSGLGVILVDMNDKICPGDFCNSVEGNMIMWRDRHHLSASYAETLADDLWERISYKLFPPVVNF